MLNHRTIHTIASGAVLLVMALAAAPNIATAADEAKYLEKYPDLRGQWMGVLRTRPGLPGQPSFDASKPWGKGQEAPLTAEYQAVLEENIKSQKEGGAFDWLGATCLGFGMPLITYGFEPQEFIVTPETTYILINWVEHNRRIYTDGRDWPKEIEPTLTGYSIGKWIDEDGDGKYDVLEVETRGFKGPRHYDAAGTPLHHDNQSVFKERIYLDKNDKNIMHNEITVYDHALTRPWTVTRDLRRNPNPRPTWREFICTENNPYVTIGKEIYYLSADGLLMPMRKGQPAPDLRYFTDAQK
jgi:hypothetical protein